MKHRLRKDVTSSRAIRKGWDRTQAIACREVAVAPRGPRLGRHTPRSAKVGQGGAQAPTEAAAVVAHSGVVRIRDHGCPIDGTEEGVLTASKGGEQGREEAQIRSRIVIDLAHVWDLGQHRGRMLKKGELLESGHAAAGARVV